MEHLGAASLRFLMAIARDPAGYRCSVYRGGTSRAIFLRADDLPPPGAARDAILLGIMGSPHARQIDGLGGGHPSLSKVAIIGPRSIAAADIDYLFAQVGVGAASVDYSANCGNISAAVGPFAIREKLVAATDGVTAVRIHNVNTGRIVTAHVPTQAGIVQTFGDLAIDGVAGTGAPIFLDFAECGGALTGSLLPTGEPAQKIRLDDGTEVTVTICDFANLIAVVAAEDMGIVGSETPAALMADNAFMARQKQVRGRAAVLLGLARDWRSAAMDSPIQPTLLVVAPPRQDEKAALADCDASQDADLETRFMFGEICHDALAGTAAVGLAAACRIALSTAGRMICYDEIVARGRLRLRHPGGIMDVKMGPEPNGGLIGIYRTARLIMDGTVFLPDAGGDGQQRSERGAPTAMRQEVKLNA